MLALSVFAILDTVPARAQTKVTLVANTGQGTAAVFSGLSSDWATEFTTGSNALGYMLTSVKIPFQAANPNNVAFSVSIRSSTSSGPGSSLGTLTLSGSLSANEHRWRQFGSTGSWSLTSSQMLKFSVQGYARAAPRDTLVANVGQADNLGIADFTADWAAEFTTGGNALGYVLTHVDIPFNAARSGSYTVSIRSSSGGNPGDKLGDLTKPGSLFKRLNTFRASGGIALDPGTAYFLVIDVTATDASTQLSPTSSNAEDSGGAAGWSIADNLRWRTWNSAGSWNTDTNNRLRFSVHGYAKTPPPPPPPVIESPKGVLVGNADQSLPITLKEGDSVPLTPLEEEGSFVYKKRTIDIPVTRDECMSPDNPAVILSKDILDRIHRRSREIAFELSDLSPQDPPPGFRVEGCAVDIDPGVAIGQGKTETVCLPPADIEGKSYIYHYNDESGEWEPLLSRIETVNGEELLCVDTDSFSQFRVFVPVIESEEVTHREDPKDVFSLTPIGEGGSIVYGPGTIDLSVTGDTDPSYANPAVIVSRSILDRVLDRSREITFELSEVSEYPPPGYRLSGFEAEVNLGIMLGEEETVSVCLPYSGGEEDIYYRYNEELGEWEVLESQLETVNGEDVLCGDAGAVSLSGVFVEETGGCAIAAASGEGVLWRGAVFNLLLIISVLLLVRGMSRLK